MQKANAKQKQIFYEARAKANANKNRQANEQTTTTRKEKAKQTNRQASKQNASEMYCPDWHTAMQRLRLQRLQWIYPGLAGVIGNDEEADRLASREDHTYGAGIMEADDHQVTTVFTVQPSFHHRHSTNPVS